MKKKKEENNNSRNMNDGWMFVSIMNIFVRLEAIDLICREWS